MGSRSFWIAASGLRTCTLRASKSFGDSTPRWGTGRSTGGRRSCAQPGFASAATQVRMLVFRPPFLLKSRAATQNCSTGRMGNTCVLYPHSVAARREVQLAVEAETRRCLATSCESWWSTLLSITVTVLARCSLSIPRLTGDTEPPFLCGSARPVDPMIWSLAQHYVHAQRQRQRKYRERCRDSGWMNEATYVLYESDSCRLTCILWVRTGLDLSWKQTPLRHAGMRRRSSRSHAPPSRAEAVQCSVTLP